MFTATPRQRCLVHKQRNILNAIPHREREDVQAELVGIWKQEKKEGALANVAAFKAKYAQRYPEAVRSLSEDEEHLLTFYAFPPGMYRHIQTTNAIESFDCFMFSRLHPELWVDRISRRKRGDIRQG